MRWVSDKRIVDMKSLTAPSLPTDFIRRVLPAGVFFGQNTFINTPLNMSATAA
jgi:hypothetical protein